MNQYSIVMPIVQYSYINDPKLKPTKKHNNFDRFVTVSLPTLLRHIVWKDVRVFIFIIRRDEEPALHERLPKEFTERVATRVIHEEDLVPGYSKKYEKYRIQMMSKLVIANHVDTPYYLILDDDVVCTRRLSRADMFVGGKLRYTCDPVFHENWWKASAEVLGMDWATARAAIKHTRIGVTPEVLSTNETKTLLSKLDVSATMHAEGRWTEYTLVWLHLIQQGRLHEVYKRGRIPLSEGRTNVWTKSDNLEAALKTLFENKKQWFGVIQSNVYDHSITKLLRAMP